MKDLARMLSDPQSIRLLEKAREHAVSMFLHAGSYFAALNQLIEHLHSLDSERKRDEALKRRVAENEMYARRGYIHIEDQQLSIIKREELLDIIRLRYHQRVQSLMFRGRKKFEYGKTYTPEKTARALRMPLGILSIYSSPSQRVIYKERDGQFDDYTIARPRLRPDGRSTMKFEYFLKKFYISPAVAERIAELELIEVKEGWKGKRILAKGSAAAFFDMIFPSKESREYRHVAELLKGKPSVEVKVAYHAARTPDALDKIVGEPAFTLPPTPSIFDFMKSFNNQQVELPLFSQDETSAVYTKKPIDKRMTKKERKLALTYNMFAEIANFLSSIPPYFCYFVAHYSSKQTEKRQKPAALFYGLPVGMGERIARMEHHPSQVESRNLDASEIQLRIIEALNMFKRGKSGMFTTLHYNSEGWYVGGIYFQKAEEMERFLRRFGVKPIFYWDEKDRDKIDTTDKRNEALLHDVDTLTIIATQLAKSGNIRQSKEKLDRRNPFVYIQEMFAGIYKLYIGLLEERVEAKFSNARAVTTYAR